MARDLDRQKQFTRRALLLGGGKALLLTILCGRLYYLQVVESERYLTLAEDNRINLRLLPPARGRILDRMGRPLATNRQDYRLVLVAERAGDVEATLQALSTLVAFPDSDRKRVLREIGRQRKFVPVAVRDNLGWEDVARIEVHSLDLPGVAIEDGESREYPHGTMLSHVVGYVAPVAEADAGADPLLALPGFRIGKAGIEKTYEWVLRGTGGSSEVEVNAVGRIVRELDRKEGVPGADLTLTLDLELQRLAVERLGTESGAAVVLDVASGGVLAMASTPGYEPAAFNRGLTPDEWKSLVSNPRAPLINKVTAGQYAPGSTFKPVVALAALDKGAIDPGSTAFCSGSLRLGNAEFHCWRRGGHGTLSMREAITQSCDCYFYECARRVGVDKIAAMGRRLGLGAPLGIDLPQERGGLLPTRDWKEQRFGSAWSQGETLICGIGQGYVLSTPLQLAVMAARIANGGRAVVPRLALDASRGDRRPPPPEPASLGLNPAHLKVVQDGMINVVNSARGTAKGAAIHEAGFEMAGKTGTSQVRRISRGERTAGVIKNEHLPWERRDHALFIGYAPWARPKFAVAVIIEHGGAGSKAAAPVGRDILLAAQKLEAARIASAATGAILPFAPAG